MAFPLVLSKATVLKAAKRQVMPEHLTHTSRNMLAVCLKVALHLLAVQWLHNLPRVMAHNRARMVDHLNSLPQPTVALRWAMAGLPVLEGTVEVGRHPAINNSGLSQPSVVSTKPVPIKARSSRSR